MPASDAPSATDPRHHALLEQQILTHLRGLLEDDRLRVDTRAGSRPANAYRQHTDEGDDLGTLRQELARTGVTDRSVESAYPKSAALDVALLRRKWFIFAETIGRIHVKVLSPLSALVRGEALRPVTSAEVHKAIAAAGASGSVPTTIVLASTTGFAPEARELAERRADRTIVLLEPNGAGGWRVSAPPETRATTDLFDPEAEADKRQRVRAFVKVRELELGGSGLAADRVSAATMLPAQLVEAELRTLAKETPGWAARRLDGRLVLFRTGPALQPATSPQEPAMLDRIKSLFERKGDNEKKIAYLSERRAALGQQRDRLYEELSTYEAKETQLKSEFKDAASQLAKRRITSQLLQIRKDAERRQQLLTVLNQQVGVVGTHLHNLELARTGTSTGLPTVDEIAEDAAKAEQVLAELQASSELAADLTGLSGGVSDEEAALMAELEAESAPAATPATPATTATPSAKSPSRAAPSTVEPPPMRISTTPERNQPEPG
jgi:hypothetical protein